MMVDFVKETHIR